MGARANIRVRQQYRENGAGEFVYLYSHWGGEELAVELKRALARKQRWDDGPYLTRIIFCEMVKGKESSETGFGISTSECDNNYNIITVDPGKGEVTIGDSEPFPFAEYIVQADDALRELMTA